MKIEQEKEFELRSRMVSSGENTSALVGTGTDVSEQVAVNLTTKKAVADETTSEPVRTRSEADDHMVEFLKQQIETKDQQIAVKDRQIESMLERNRETNILIQGLQTNLARVAEALPAPHRGDRNPQGGDNSGAENTPDDLQ